MAIVLKVLFAKPTLHVLNYMVLQEFPEQLKGLVPGDLGPKVMVPPQQLVQPVDGFGTREAVVITTEM